MPITAASLGSPCTGICRIDEATSYCLGCGRTSDEIASWRFASDTRKQEIWTALPGRFEALGLTVTRLPWQQSDILEFVVSGLEARQGTWVMGCHGATAEFMCDREEGRTLDVAGTLLTAASVRGALRLNVLADLRALQLRDPANPAGYRAIFLVRPKPNAEIPGPAGFTALGPDHAAVSASDSRDALYDLGLGRADLRFCIRLPHGDLATALAPLSGFHLNDLLKHHGMALLNQSPDRVVETDIGRIEVKTRIPLPGETSPNGPHTHLLPGHLATGRATTPGIDLPSAYRLCATYYPKAVGDEAPQNVCGG